MTILFYFQSRLKPGRMLLVDTEEKQIIQDVELKLKIARSRPHSLWLKNQVFMLSKYSAIMYTYGVTVNRLSCGCLYVHVGTCYHGTVTMECKTLSTFTPKYHYFYPN